MSFKQLALLLGATLAFTGCGDDGGDDDDGTTMIDAGATPDAMTGGNPPVPALGTQVDRMGRAAINTATVSTFSGDDTAKGMAKDGYNAATQANWSNFTADIQGNLGILDSLDADCGNQLLATEALDANRYAALAGILTDDQLYLHADRGGACTAYLGLEGEVAIPELEPPNGGCGGRTLTYDVIETSYSVLAAGDLGGIDDTIEMDADCTPSEMFPYLCEPTVATSN